MLLDNIKFIQFFPDLFNIVFLITIIFFLTIKYKINEKYFFILSLSLFLPFLFYFIWDWSLLPDQSKYLYRVYNLRNFSYKEVNSIFFSRVDFSSLLLALFPIPFVSTIVSISLINKGMLTVCILYFVIKKKYNFLVFLLLFLPSIIVVSSTALRDTLVIVIAIFFFYFFIEKKNYFKSLFFSLLFLLTKPHFAIISIIVCMFYYFFFIKLKLKKLNKLSSITMSICSIFFFILFFLLKDLLISYKFGFFSEEFDYKLVPRYIDVNIYSIFYSFLNFIISPLFSVGLNLKNFIIFIENMFVIYLFIILLKKVYVENQLKAIFWITICLIVFGIFGFTIVNAGTIWRYKLIINITFLSAIYFSLKNKPLS